MLRDIHDFLNVVKKGGKAAVSVTDPVHVLFGEVASDSPLKILVEQRLELEEEHLILTRAVRDYEIEMTVEHFTEDASGGEGFGAYDAHKHEYKGRKKFLIHNGLVLGDKVKLLRVQGGQQYVVFDKE